MLWPWIGLFVLVGASVLGHRKATGTPAGPSVVGWWLAGLSFAAVLYPMYQYGWFGAELHETSDHAGIDAAAMYVSSYLLVYVLSFDAVALASWYCHVFRVPAWHHARVRRWALVVSVGSRTVIMVVAVGLVRTWPGLFYLLGGVTLYAAWLALRPPDEVAGARQTNRTWTFLSARQRTTERFGEGEVWVRERGRVVVTSIGACVLAIALRDLALALDSVVVVSVSRTTFIVVAANLLATVAQRAWGFARIEGVAFPRATTVAFLTLIALKMITQPHVHVSPVAWLGVTLVIACAAVVESRPPTRT